MMRMPLALAQQQNGLGFSPTPPPPVFQNQTDAAMNAAAGISGAVQSTGWEWGAALYKNSDGMVGITPLRTDHDPGSVGVSELLHRKGYSCRSNAHRGRPRTHWNQ